MAKITTMISRLLVLSALVLVGTAVSMPTANAVPDPCIQYNDPIHMGSYPVCPLDVIR